MFSLMRKERKVSALSLVGHQHGQDLFPDHLTLEQPFESECEILARRKPVEYLPRVYQTRLHVVISNNHSLPQVDRGLILFGNCFRILRIDAVLDHK